eukprot:2621769-Pleurochrysis_carterae.AAC.4
MNAAIADSILALTSTADAAARGAGGWMGEFDGPDNEIENTADFYEMIAAYGLNKHGEDNPTWAQAMKSDKSNQWRDAARSESKTSND